jgi:hypothetical protein
MIALAIILAGAFMIGLALAGRTREIKRTRCQFCGSVRRRCPDWCPYVPPGAENDDKLTGSGMEIWYIG